MTAEKGRICRWFLFKRLMGLEPTTFCMASSGEGPDYEQECGLLAVGDCVGLRPITVGLDTI